MVRSEKADLTILSEKGQVVIPAKIRSRMGLKPKTKFLVYECDDSVILKKFVEPDLSKELEAIYKRVDEKIAKYGELSNDDINEIIHEYRQRKKTIKVRDKE
ncbi:MAG: AbrB/MazE/SpoVT family DNA-binding domain-containing protein [Candidatus Bathyarchaeia archaeon]|jgi:AbrB family looped-hinge helix DNA binding protein